MLDRQLTLNALMMDYCKTLLEDVADESLAEQPFPGANHAAWVLGHLAMTADQGSQLFGAKSRLPEDWKGKFSGGSTPTSDRAAYPAKAELLTALEEANARLVAAARAATAEQLDAPNTFTRLAKALPTVGDLVAMLLTTHIAQHVGQLSAWRRALGKPPLF